MSKELIENLRSVGRLWEDEAADLIERLTIENKNLLLANRDCIDHFNVMKDDLAAAQAQLKVMREALENCRLIAARYRKEDWAQHALRICADVGVSGSVLRQEGDDSALREMLAKERERCAVLCEEIDVAAFGSDRPAPNDCATAIRAMGSES